MYRASDVHTREKYNEVAATDQCVDYRFIPWLELGALCFLDCPLNRPCPSTSNDGFVALVDMQCQANDIIKYA